MEGKNHQTAFSNNNVRSPRANLPKSATMLEGYLGNSLNGGHNKTIYYKKIMAGEKHYETGMQLRIKMLTPLTPAYQDLKCTIRTYFVPNSRVWDNAEKYEAQKGGATEIKIAEIPNLGGKNIPYMITNPNETDPTLIEAVNIFSTESWRENNASSYIPRIGNGFIEMESDFQQGQMPAISVLPLRGRIAIYNDFERDKRYSEAVQEYKEDTVSNAEWERYVAKNQNDWELMVMRAKRPNSYYTDYRTEMQGFDSEFPSGDIPANQALVTWMQWEQKYREAVSESNNENLNPWDVIAKIRGSKLLTEGKVQLLGEKTFKLNYSSITQNAYNNNEEVQEQFRVLGQQGAYSYTENYVPLYAGHEFVESGYIHVIMTVWANTIFEKGIDRNLLNITPFSEYRPDLIEDKQDVIYEAEFGAIKNATDLNPAYYNQVKGFKRKYSEYFKAPNVIAGDLTTDDFVGMKNFTTADLNKPIITQSTYQFYEKDSNYYEPANTGSAYGLKYKKPWLDFTDLHINKNQAIMNEVDVFGEAPNTVIHVKGQNQIDVVGMFYCSAELPIDESIKNNFTDWGEH